MFSKRTVRQFEMQFKTFFLAKYLREHIQFNYERSVSMSLVPLGGRDRNVRTSRYGYSMSEVLSQ